MTPALITTTLAVVLYSLWVRRRTWRSRWEVGATAAIATEGCALVLMSPWASELLGPALHDVAGLWNLQHVLGHLCLIAAVAAITYHVLVRLADEDQVRLLFRVYVRVPIRFGVLLLAAAFVIADEGYHEDLFAVANSDIWLTAYWLVTGSLLIYLSIYSGRLLLILRTDPRATATVDRYLISAGFGVTASVLQMATAWTALDATPVVWLCACLAVAIFAYASAQSWRAKVAWFTPDDTLPSQRVPPQASA